MIINHKFKNHTTDLNCKYLIIGTFNPDVKNNPADFFYGRPRNHLWSMLPKVFEKDSLKQCKLEEKLHFMSNTNIDFIDLVESINIEPGHENNYYDSYIDSKIIKWMDVKKEIDKLTNLKYVFFTRKTFTGIPNIKTRVLSIEKYCKNKFIIFKYLETPSRYENEKKLKQWMNSFL